MKLVKVMLGVVLVLVLAVAGLVFYVYSNLDGIVKQLIESEGPKLTHTTVAVDNVALSPLKGKGQLAGVKIGNPEGFSTEHLLLWESILLDINVQSLNTDVVVLDDLRVEGVHIILEQKGSTTNLQQLLKALESDSASPENNENTAAAQESIKVAVKHVLFENNRVEVVTENYGRQTVEMPQFELNNLGDPGVGLTPEELGVAIVRPLVKKALRTAEDKAKDMAKEKLKQEAKAKLGEHEDAAKKKLDEALGEKDKEKLKQLKDLF